MPQDDQTGDKIGQRVFAYLTSGGGRYQKLNRSMGFQIGATERLIFLPLLLKLFLSQFLSPILLLMLLPQIYPRASLRQQCA